MPFVSQAQRAFMHIHHPELAAEFESATPKGKKLPQHVGDKKKKKALGKKLAVALQSQQLIPGAPPVKRITGAPGQPPKGPQPAPGAPQAQQSPQGVPQQPTAPIPQAPQASDILTQQKAQQPMQKHPGAVTNSEAILAEKLNKMAAVAYQCLLGRDLKGRLGK